jgi:outer membrane protein TolC
MRWKLKVAALALGLAWTVGCKQQCYMTECDLKSYSHLMPDNLPCDPNASIIPTRGHVAAPANVLDPERPIRYLSLSEAIAMGLEWGTVGSPALNGTTNTSLVSFQGRAVFAPENNIRVLALDPAIVGSDIEASLAKFDVRWDTSMTWQTTDEPTGGNFINSFQNGERATFNSSLLKPLPTGGVAGITFTTTYTFLNSPPTTPGQTFANPAYRPSLQFQFEQPLLQGFGVEINQIRPTHPGSQLTPFNVGGRVEGVLITRLRFDQQRAEFERNLHVMLVNIEVAYWNLYGSYWALYSREQALRQAFEAWKINRERFEAGRIPVQDMAQTRQQYESFRAQRIQALGQVLENERALRALIGLPVEDGTRLVPIDTPTLTPYHPDWDTAWNEAMALRPELILARHDLKFRQLDLINQRNLLLPDLRFTSTYNINGLGTHLGGGPNDPNNALASLGKDQFNDWQIGLRMDVPLGFRDANAAVRAARLGLARSYGVLQDQESKAEQFLALEYANLIEFYELIRAQRSQREAAAIQLGARFKEFLAGRGTLDFLLEAQRVWADALRDEYNAIVQYNNALISFEFAKGTIMQHDNVVIGEGPLPNCAQVRAVEHERQRSKALVLRERAQPVAHPAIHSPEGVIPGAPVIPDGESPSLPSLLEGQGPAPAMPQRLPVEEQLPSPSKTGGGVAPAPAPVVAGPQFHASSPYTASSPATLSTTTWPAATPLPSRPEAPAAVPPAPPAVGSYPVLPALGQETGMAPSATSPAWAPARGN